MIGVFDSGLGGLSVFKQIVKTLPNYNYIYLGDNARVPYGEKSPETVYRYTQEAVDFLAKKGCKLILVACNTASALALRKIQREYLPQKYPQLKVLGVIRPLAEYAACLPEKKIAIIGTRGTISSGAYEKEIKKINPKKKIKSWATPLLVPLVEEGWRDKITGDKIIENYLKPIKKWGAENLILGCTHYPFIIGKIKRYVSPVKVPNPGKIISLSLQDYLYRHPELKIKKEEDKKRFFMVTEKNRQYKKMIEKFLGQKIKNFSQVEL